MNLDGEGNLYPKARNLGKHGQKMHTKWKEKLKLESIAAITFYLPSTKEQENVLGQSGSFIVYPSCKRINWCKLQLDQTTNSTSMNKLLDSRHQRWKMSHERITRLQSYMFNEQIEKISRQLVEQANEDENMLISIFTELFKEISMKNNFSK